MATTNNSKFIPFEYLQEYFVDRNTGLPLSGGIVTFYKDNSRSEKKDIYQKVGSPNPPISDSSCFVKLPNPLILSSVGTFIDPEYNDINVYAYPYDEYGDTELYYITVYSNDGFNNECSLQFTREGEPYRERDEGGESSLNDSYTNFITNGQFLIRNYIPNLIIDAITYLTPDGWTYEKNENSLSKDIISFERIGSYTEFPSRSPRYDCRVRCTEVFAGDSFKGIRIKFNDVNTFSNTVQTFSFSATSLTNLQVQIRLIRNYGSDVGTVDTTIIENVEIAQNRAVYSIPIDFPDNSDKVIGNKDDDFIQIEISLPSASIFDFRFTDAVLTPGDVEIKEFPVSTKNMFSSNGLGGSISIPSPTAMDIYLPLILTTQGIKYDHSKIGSMILKTDENLNIGELWADGSQYLAEGYSDDGIPFARLANKYMITDVSTGLAGLYRYGSGKFFISATIRASNKLKFYMNSNGAVNHANAGNSGLSFSTYQEGNASNQYQFEVTCVDKDLTKEGSYWTFIDLEGNSYYVWYRIDDKGDDPNIAGTRTGIVVDLYTNISPDYGIIENTFYSVNKKYFAVPDFSGYFPRFWNKNNTSTDPDSATRKGSSLFAPYRQSLSIIEGNNIGTMELSGNLTHNHIQGDVTSNHVYGGPVIGTYPRTYATTGDYVSIYTYTSSSGISEARSINVSVGAAILY